MRALAAVLTLLLAGCAAVEPGPEPVPATGASAEPPRAAATSAPASPAPPTADVPPTRAPGSWVPEPRGSVASIGPELAERMAASWRPGCPVPLADLRYLTVPYLDMSGAPRTGELVVHEDVATDVLEVFAALRAARFPIASMRLVDDFDASDDASMAADNTSAFNCRLRTGGSTWSEHAYGRAIDLNPVENPYVRGSHVAPRAGAAYVDRPDLPGVVHEGDVVVEAFAAIGWVWGGTWTDGVLDYQHFSANGR